MESGDEAREGGDMRNDFGFTIAWLILMFFAVRCVGELAKSEQENAALRKRLDYWECTDRTPEQPGEPTPITDVVPTDAYKSLLHQ